MNVVLPVSRRGYLLAVFLGAVCGGGMKRDSNFSIDDLPKSLLSMVAPISFCRDDFDLVGGFSVEADGLKGCGFGKGMMDGRGGNVGKC